MSKYNDLKKLSIGVNDLKNMQLTLIKLVSSGAVDYNSNPLDIVNTCTSLIDDINKVVVDRNKEIELGNK